MQVKLGPLVSVAAGSIGGTTFQRSFIATLVRSKPMPTLRRGRYTNPKRSTWQQFSRTWRTVSNSDRDKWQIAADTLAWLNKFGDDIRGKGYWLYMRCNQNLASLGIANIAAPDSVFTFTAITGLAATGSLATTLSLSWSTPTPTQAGTQWLVFASRPMSAGRSAPYGTLRLITVLASGATSPANVGSAYNTKFNLAQKIGLRTFISVIPIDRSGGYAGPAQLTSFIWT